MIHQPSLGMIFIVPLHVYIGWVNLKIIVQIQFDACFYSSLGMYSENCLIFAGMKPAQLVHHANPLAQQGSLQAQVLQLRSTLDAVTSQVRAFEALLQSELAREIILEQELTVLYKSRKAEKKAKRLAQKQKGKNHVEPVGLKAQKQTSSAPVLNAEESKEKKRLYREAMLLVHPDKFSMNADKVDLATALTTRLIEIYKHEDLATLVAYHAHLFHHTHLSEEPKMVADKGSKTAPDAYLQMQLAQLKKQLAAMMSRYSYHVLTTYEHPATFVDELKAYYRDRIRKLKRRTRT